MYKWSDRFLWIFCQLEVLRQCPPRSVRRTFDELPKSLDETYERILKKIKKPNKRFSQRVLQFLLVAVRPLRVEELVEVLAFDFDDAEGIPRLKPDWRWEEQELALLSACSSLIAIVEVGDLRVVQFSHLSVKEFLTSPRLATASGEVSNYYIDLEPAHTILAQACLGVLLQTQDDVDKRTHKTHPARYAAEHWATHAQFGEGSSRLHRGMEYLFDANKPHFKVWLMLCDIDIRPDYDSTFGILRINDKSPAAPLYYAALCGFHDLVAHLITKNPQNVNAVGGYYMRPIVAALAGGHFQTADLLRHNGADLHVWANDYTTPLLAATFSGNLEVVRKLIEYDHAEINVGDVYEWTPLHLASMGHNFKDDYVLRFLLEHGADINARNQDGSTPLLVASFHGALEVVSLLLERGADVEARRNDGKTALQLAVENGDDDVVELLREHGPE